MNAAARRRALLSLLVALALVASIAPFPAAAAAEVEITYLANEGFLLAAGETRVLVDALFRPAVRGYPVLPAAERERLESAAGEYGGVDLVLASHHHGDHFSAAAVERYLRAEPAARFVSTPQAVAQLAGAGLGERVEGVLPAEGERVVRRYPGIGLTVLNLDHGPGTDAENLGLLVELAGVKLLHVGDTEVTAAALTRLGLAEEGIDVAFVPTWQLLGREAEAWVEALGADRLVAMHLPVADAPAAWFGAAGDLAGLERALADRWPRAVVPPQAPGPLLTMASPGGSGESGEGDDPEPSPMADPAGFLEREAAADPDNGAVQLVLAMTRAAAGETEAALAALARLPALGWDYPLDDVDFPALAQHPEYRAIARRLAAAAPRAAPPKRLLTVAERDLVPEGTAYDPVTGDLFFSSITRRKVVRLTAGGRVEDYLAPAQDGLLATLGMEVDPEHRLLWVVSSVVNRPPMDGLTPELAGRAAVHAFDLGSRRLVHRFTLGSPEEPSILNDLTLLPGGGAAVTDTLRGTVYRADPATGELTALLPAGSFAAPNGIATDGAGERLYVATFRGVSVVDLASRRVQPLATPGGMARLAGIDGLYWREGELIAFQNLLGMPRIWRLALDAAGTAVTSGRILMSALPGDGLHHGPTTGAVAGDRFVYIANPQGRRLDDDGQLLPVDALDPLQVVAVPLEPGGG